MGYPQQMRIDPATAEPATADAVSIAPAPAVARERLRAALKRSASALKEAGVPFALAGSYALWVHGAAESEHDVDLVVPEARVEAAVDVLSAAGFAIERPPEDWLFKAFLDDAMVDVLHRLNNRPVDAELIAGAGSVEVLGMHIPALSAAQVVTGKMLAMTERYCDFGQLLPAVRAVREQVDWTQIERDTADNDFAAAFLFLLRRLGIADRSVNGAAATPSVVTPSERRPVRNPAGTTAGR